MRLSIFAALLCGIALVQPAAAQDMRGKLMEESRMQHERAHELKSSAEADQSMAQQFNDQAMRLEDHAHRLDGRALEFRAMASQYAQSPGSRDQLMKFAEESENYARSDRQNAGFRRRLGSDLANSARASFEDAQHHEEHARRIDDFLRRFQ